MWHYTTFIDFIDHWQTLISGLIALIAAVIAVMLTINVEQIKALASARMKLEEQINFTNTATMLSFGVCNTALNAKKQLIKPIKDQYDHQKRLATQLIKAQNTGSSEPIVFTADFRSLPPLTLPLSILQEQVFDKLVLYGRPIALITTMMQVADDLNICMKKRNELIILYKATNMTETQKICTYFGLSHGGIKNEEYPNLIEAIYTQIDNVIFFSSQLTKDLSENGDRLAASFRKAFREKAPRIIKPDFKRAIDDGLMPDDDSFSEWLSMFAKREL